MYHLITKCGEKNDLPKLIHSIEYGYSESKTQAAHCAVSGTVCEQKVLPLSTDYLNKD